MASNTTVLIIVVAVAALVITGLVTLVVRTTRNQNRHGLGETIRKQVSEDSLRHRRREVLAVESDATPEEAGLTLAAPAPNRRNPVAVSPSGSP